MNYYTDQWRPNIVQRLIKRVIYAVLVFLVIFIVMDLTVGPSFTEVIKEQLMVVTRKDSITKTISLQPLEKIGNAINFVEASIEQVEYILSDNYAGILDSIVVGDQIKVKEKKKTGTLLGVKTEEETELLSMQKYK